MDYALPIDRISMDLPILYFKGSQVEISIYDAFPSQIFVFIFANSADPDVMPHDVAFHLGLHCLQKHLFTGI